MFPLAAPACAGQQQAGALLAALRRALRYVQPLPMPRALRHLQDPCATAVAAAELAVAVSPRCVKTQLLSSERASMTLLRV